MGLSGIPVGILVLLHRTNRFSDLWLLDSLFLVFLALGVWGLIVLDRHKARSLPHAFISYSHARDSTLVPALRHAIILTAKPIGERRVRYPLMDRTDLEQKTYSQSELEAALGSLAGRAKFFVLLASQEAAVSEWVTFEINAFLAKKGIEQFLIILTDGDIVWDPDTMDFDWRHTNALPRCLSGKFDRAPSYLDLRTEGVRIRGRIWSDRKLRGLIAPLIASIDEADVATVRAFMAWHEIRVRFVVGLSVLLVSLGVFAFLLVRFRKR